MPDDLGHLEGEVMERLDEPSPREERAKGGGSSVRVDADVLAPLCERAVLGIAEYRARSKLSEIASERKRYMEENTPGRIGRFFGRKAPEPPTDEWVWENLCHQISAKMAMEESLQVAKKLLSSCRYGRTVLVSASDLHRVESAATWAPKGNGTYR